MNDLEPRQRIDEQHESHQRLMPLSKATRPLPPDLESMNDERASWADQALQHFRRVTRADHEDALGDLLCNLMHWSVRNNFDFNLALQRAEGHYEAETETVPQFPPSETGDLA